jgi:AraC-like DNA-binding protein
VAYIEDHVANEIALATTAPLTRLSSRAFKQTFCIPPQRFQVHRRIERAKPMLRRPAAAVTSVGIGGGVLRYKLILDGVSKGRGHDPDRLSETRLTSRHPAPTANSGAPGHGTKTDLRRFARSLGREQRFFYVAMLLPPRFRYSEVRRAAVTFTRVVSESTDCRIIRGHEPHTKVWHSHQNRELVTVLRRKHG